ncbi:MAG: hypothetical protein WDO12_01670 [Pseudomonadota bacterium]
MVEASELKTGETMKLITRFELASNSTNELHVLRGDALKVFNLAARGTQERRDALLSLTNLYSEIASRPAP